jgi:fucose 4-O-acetylase-like acetyltransferase
VVKAARNGLVDYGRLAAALGVVWLNSHAPGGWAAYAALPFFLVLFAMPSSVSPGQRAGRLVQPYVTWSLVFALVHIALAMKANEPPLGWWDWSMLLGGTWMHLWVLPFAFVAILLAPWFRHPLASFLGATAFATFLVVKGVPQTIPFGQWSFGVIPVLVGVAFFSWGWRLAVITLLGSWLILQLGRPVPENMVILVGTGLSLACLTWRLPQTSASDLCARLSVWVFLGHPLVILAGQSLRITWVELGLFSLVGSVMLALLLDSATQTTRRGRLELS